MGNAVFKCLSEIRPPCGGGDASAASSPSKEVALERAQVTHSRDAAAHQRVHHDRANIKTDHWGHQVYGSDNARFFGDRYERARNAGHVHGDRMHEYGQKAHQCWASGDRSAAHEWSEKRKAEERLMHAADKAAVEEVLKTQKHGDKWARSLDLHGLYVHEAEDTVHEFVHYWNRHASPNLKVEIITGKGLHSANHEPKIRPVIRKLLGELHLNYHLEEHNNGAFEVTGFNASHHRE